MQRGSRTMRNAIAISMVMMAGPALASDCRIDQFSIVFGSDSQTRMVVKTGRLCSIMMHMGLTNRSAYVGGPNAISISTPASHGVASTPTPRTWTYVSQPGYVGQDHFVFDQTGEVMTTRRVVRGTSHIDVDVDVVP